MQAREELQADAEYLQVARRDARAGFLLVSSRGLGRPPQSKKGEYEKVIADMRERLAALKDQVRAAAPTCGNNNPLSHRLYRPRSWVRSRPISAS
jgi:hypothetical protein